MKKNFAKVLSVFLAVLMLMSVVPITVGAASSGTCGTNLTWALDSSGTLTISGSGIMSTYNEDNEKYAPWYSDRSSIKKIVIESGVKSIGNDAFYGLRNLTDVSIAESVSTIYSGAFSSCTALSSIKIPDGVTAIYSDVFSGCYALKSVNLGKGLSSFSATAFNGCTALTAVNMASGNEAGYYSKDGILYINKTLVYYPLGKTDSVVNIDSSITHVTANVFYKNENITSVNMPGVTKISQKAFFECVNLVSVNMPKVEEIAVGAFFGCSALKTVYLGKLKSVNTNSLAYDTLAFSGCSIDDVYFDGSVKEWNDINRNGVSCNLFNAKNKHFSETVEMKYESADKFYFGSYPGSLVTDEKLLAQLNAADGQYTFIADTGKNNTYAEIELDGNKYRAVFDDNENISAWYKYTPVLWEVLDPANGLIVALRVVDIRAYSYNKDRTTFAESDLRAWLNNDFYSQAFSESEQDKILTRTIHNDQYSDYYMTHYGAEDSVETIFVPCFSDKDSTIYYMYNPSYTDYSRYARDNSNSNYDKNRIWSRTFCNTSPCYFSNVAYSRSYFMPASAEAGIVPMMYVDIENVDCEHFYEAKITAPTCTEQGYTTYTCACGDSYIEDYVNATGHSYIAKVTAPTCTEKGYTTYTCTCSDSYVADYVDATGHSHTSRVTTPATHTREGVLTYTCHCGNTYTEAIAKLEGHTYTAKVTAPTCTEQGYTTYICACSDSYVADYVDATGHSHTSRVTTPATHTREGVLTYTCHCGNTYTEAIAKLEGHTYNAVVTAPTCTKQGYTTYTCACSDIYITDYVPAAGHKYQSYVYQAATHTSTGIMMYDCNNCTSYYTTTIPKTEAHTYNTQVTAPTCTAQGYTTYTCACGDTYVADYVNANGHSHKGSVTTPATHLKEGVMTYNCICGDSYTEVIAKLTAHTYSTQVTAPTCTAQGYTTYTCACGDTYVADYVNANGHSHKGNVTTPATHLKEGVMTYTCHCGDTYTTAIAKLTKHTYKAQVTTAATHLTQGVKTYTCECGDTYTEAIATTPEHTYQKETIKKATCTQNGTRLYFCECGSEYTETISATGHKDSNGDVMCDSCGVAVCSHMCHQTGFMGFIWKIVKLFWKLFGMNPVCECGLAHY